MKSVMGDDPVERLVQSLPPETIERIRSAPTSTIRAFEETAVHTPVASSLSALPVASIKNGVDFEPVKLLGEGGIGRVHLARQKSLQREVAIKSVRPDRRNEATESSLLAEALHTGALEHPNIVPVHALGLDDRHGPVLVMKRVEGQSWRERLRADPPVGDALDRHLEILMQVCNAVHFAHTRGIVHRDIKPENVMVGEFGEVYLVDWGLALRLDERGQSADLVGTPAYMAPEMLLGDSKVTAQSDVYLLGAVLYHMLTGHPPHRGDDVSAILCSVAVGEPPAVGDSTPPGLAVVCARAMRRSPEARYPSALAMREAIANFLRHRGSTRLANDAFERLAETRCERDPAARRRGLVECEFGLRQALRAWSDNADAERALDECLGETVLLEIDDKNLGAARRVLEGMRAPSTELREKVDALAKRLEKEEAERALLAKMERDRDAGISRGARLALACIAIFINIGSAIWSELERTGSVFDYTSRMVLESSGPTVVVFAALMLAFRKPFFRNQINRQITLSVIAVAFMVLSHRVLGVLLDRPAVNGAIEEMFLIGTACAVMGVSLMRWMFVASALAIASAFVAALRPEWTIVLMATVLSIPFIAMVWGKPT